MIISLFFILGAMIGSFLNVCIYRIPNNESVVKPPSHCFSCGERLKYKDMVPVIGYFLNKGRCKYCGTKYSIRYSSIELMTGIIFSLVYLRYGYNIETLYMLILCSTIIVMIFIDIDHHIIPDRIHAIIIILGIIRSVHLTHNSLAFMIGGFLIGGGVILLVALIGPMGGGDIKLFASLGLWLGPFNTVFAIILSFVIGGIYGALLLLFKFKDRKDQIAFGPFIGLSGLAMIMFYREILSFYLRWIL